jgi:membrane-associated phospholipid phosphatase
VRFSARREVALGLGAYAVYLLVRAAVANAQGREEAARNARRLEAFERRLGIHVEPAVQRTLVPNRATMRALAAGYVALNVVMTVGSLGRLFRRRHPEFHRIRRAGLAAIVAPSALFYAFPCDPPRKLDHMTDPIADHGIDLESGLIVKLYNPIAAFPSIHMAFAVVTAAALLADARSRTGRALARAYPAGVAYVVVATGNHFVVDVAAGSALAALALRLARPRGS